MSTWLRRLDGVARAGVFTGLLLTAVYALFAAIPFTSTQVIRGRLIEPLARFADWHPAFMVLMAVLLVWALREELLTTRLDAIGLTLVVAVLAVADVVYPALPRTIDNGSGFAIAIAALVLVLWLAVVNLRTIWRRVAWSLAEAADDARLWAASGAATLYVAAMYAVVWWSRSGGTPAGGARPLAIAWTVCAHATVFAAVFVALMLARAVAAASTRPARAEFLLVWVAVTWAMATVLQRLVFATIAYSGPRATLAAWSFALALSTTMAVARLRAGKHASRPVESGIGLWLTSGDGWLALRVLAVLLLAPVAIVVTNQTARMDWNYLVQELSAILVWSLALAGCFGVIRSSRRWSVAVLVGLAALAPVGLAVTEARADRADAEAYANFDPSFRVIYQAIGPGNGAALDPQFFRYLQDSTNIPRERQVAPAAIDLVSAFVPPSVPPPHIFLIVIDSLRRDYLSPYNPAVTFTPEIAAFAAESDVYTRAFTHYGATGLSEPSIWAGSMLVHKQYVTPFAPMNALAKVLANDGYAQFVSIDTILGSLLERSPGLTEMDAGRPTKDYDLCLTLPELQRRAASAVAAGSQPVFGYTQPQNLHVSAINRAGGNVPDGQRYPGFYEPYAARVRRVDGCFGQFIAYLRDSGLWDNSIVVLASDHGDSVGEEGRFGHAYTLFPEVIRIPLIMHVPARLRADLQTDHDAPAFSTDITPTLYALLGHAPTLRSPLQGRSLFRPVGTPAPAPATDYLIASSYGPVYALLDGSGQRLYIADGVNFKDDAFDVTPLVATRVPVTAADRTAGRQRIREHIAEINSYFNFDPASP